MFIEMTCLNLEGEINNYVIQKLRAVSESNHTKPNWALAIYPTSIHSVGSTGVMACSLKVSASP